MCENQIVIICDLFESRPWFVLSSLFDYIWVWDILQRVTLVFRIVTVVRNICLAFPRLERYDSRLISFSMYVAALITLMVVVTHL